MEKTKTCNNCSGTGRIADADSGCYEGETSLCIWCYGTGVDDKAIPQKAIIEKRPMIYAADHSKAALDAALIADDVVPDRTDSLLYQYPFLSEYVDTQEKRLEYDNAPYYQNARWLILTMAEHISNNLNRPPIAWILSEVEK